jgi:hypothetical protein
MITLDDFTRAYIAAIYFTETGEDDQPSPGAEMAPDFLAQCVEDCAEFQSDNAGTLARAYATGWYSEESAGHDFWLTRNRHGAGFWDRGLPDGIGDELTRAAHPYGRVDTYCDDDGRIDA